MDINACESYREGTHSRFVSAENHCTHIGENPKKKYIRQYRVDGKVLPPGKEPKRCDFLLLNDTDKDSYYIELKGSDIRTAIEQIESTISLVNPSINYTVFCRIISHKVRSHEIQDNFVIRWKRKRSAIIISGKYTDTL